MNCQGCESVTGVGVVASDGEPPYRLCFACAHRLEARALRPREWMRIAAIHGWRRFLLHDDFYDDDGTATNPVEPVENAEQHAFPSSEEWAVSLPLALDVALVKWTLPQDLVARFSASPTETLALLQKVVAERSSPQIRDRALEIAARAVGAPAEEWVRQQWTQSPHSVLFRLAQASAACLPRVEGLERVISSVASSGPNMADTVGCLSWFEDERALDAIERLIQPPITEAWGRAAAACGLSWSRAVRWLHAGRPTSLVALDALAAFARYNTGLLWELRPRLGGPVDAASFQRVLQEYAVRDSVPRVKRAVAALLASADTILGNQVQKGPVAP